MKRLSLLVWLFAATAFVTSADQQGDFQVAASAWEDLAAAAAGSVTPQQSKATFANLDGAWQRLPQSAKEAAWPRMALAYVGQSESELASSNANAAAQALRAAGILNQRFGGRLEYATKSPVSFFERLAKLQTGITQATAADPLAGLVNYLFRKDGEKYIVARQELDPEVKGITVDGVADSEALAQVHELSAQDGQAVLEKTRWVIGPKGRVEETVRRATREVSFDEDGRLSAKPISTPVLGSREAPPPQPSATPPAATPAPSTPVPTATPAPSSPAPTVAESPAPVVERKSPVWPWLVGIAALTVIALLVWKRRT